MSTKLHFKRAVCAFALLATSVVPVLGQAVTNTPWDVVINGNYTGNAQLYFFEDFTLGGIQLVTSATKGKSEPDIERGGSDTGRLPDDSGGTNSPSPTVIKRLDGSSAVAGTWTIDSKGKLIGIYSAIGSNGTNSFTNAVSFVGRVKPGKLSMSASSTYGKFTLKGVPLVVLPSIAGNWYANGEKSGQPFIELFTLDPAVLPNQYYYSGTGADYTLTGKALLSIQKRLSIVTSNDSDTNNEVIRSLSGSFKSNSKGTNAILRGSESGSSSDTNSTSSKILFRATKQ